MEFAVDPDEFLQGSSRKHGINSEAKRAFVKRMKDSGFSLRQTAQAMGVNASSVLHHLRGVA
jgi:hypothetical protein